MHALENVLSLVMFGIQVGFLYHDKMNLVRGKHHFILRMTMMYLCPLSEYSGKLHVHKKQLNH